jgi:outer membrane protein OmpA-like peptidoglycan-associated protein
MSFGGDYGGIEANLNFGYLIRNGEVRREFGNKGQQETINRPNALIGGVGLGVNPGTEAGTITVEVTGMLNSAYESGSLEGHKDTNLEVTVGGFVNAHDFMHIGIGGSYQINNSWGPYAGPDYRVFFTHSVDVGLIAGDRDKDGIRDNKDRCPDDPEDYDAFEDTDGCPDLDNDNDGIPDTEDQCPDDPEDIDGFEDIDGCPDPDNDGDGILDVDDKCPNEPENFNGIDDEDGCPDEKAEPEVKRFTLEGLKFQPNSAELVPGTYASLEKAGEMLREYPEINVLIEGHAASTGRPDFEQSLSQERADSIKKYLVGTYGIDSGRIRTMGFGSTKPIGDNSTEFGRKKNRRIEFVVE